MGWLRWSPVLFLLSHCSSQEPLCNPHQSLDDIVNEISSLISPNQAAANCSSTSSSAESSTTTKSPRVSIHVVMQVTKEIATYGRRTAAANAIWARSHSHTMSVHGPLGGSRPAPRGYDARFGKVQFLRKSAEGAQEDAQNEHKWLLWLDADAFVAVHHDWAKEVILRFGSAAHVIASLDPGEDGTLNTGVLLVKRSAWSVNFLNDYIRPRSRVKPTRLFSTRYWWLCALQANPFASYQLILRRFRSGLSTLKSSCSQLVQSTAIRSGGNHLSQASLPCYT